MEDDSNEIADRSPSCSILNVNTVYILDVNLFTSLERHLAF